MVIFTVRNSEEVSIFNGYRHSIEFNNIKSYKEAMNIIKNIGGLISYDDRYLIALHVKKEEFGIIAPYVYTNTNRDLYSMDSWTIFYDVRGLIIYEDLQNEFKRINIDPFEYKKNEIKVGDYIYSEIDRRYFLVIKDLKENLTFNCLFGINEPFEEQFDGQIPLKYIHKVSDFEINQLKLYRLKSLYKYLQEHGASDEYYEMIEEYRKESPWL